MSNFEANGGISQPLRLHILVPPDMESSSVQQERPSCRIEPLDPSVPKPKKKSKPKSSDVPVLNLETIPQLEQQAFKPVDDVDVREEDVRNSSEPSSVYGAAVDYECSSSIDYYKCSVCGTKYSRNNARFYTAHMAQHTCPICKKILPFKDVVNHVKLHLVNQSTTEGKLDIPCQFCAKRFKTLLNYDTHITQVHRCPVCDQCFGKKKVIEHIGSHFGPDGSIKLDAPLNNIVGQGDRIDFLKDSSTVKVEKRKREESDSDDYQKGGSFKLVVKIPKVLKQSNEKEEEDEGDDDEDEDDEEDDEEDPIRKDFNRDSDGDDGDDDNDETGHGLNKDQKVDNFTNKDGSSSSNNKKSQNENQQNSHHQKDANHDEDCDLDNFHLEEIERDGNDNIEDSLYEDFTMENGGDYSEADLNAIKEAKAQYTKEIADRLTTVIENNTCTMCGVSCQYSNRIRKHVRKSHYCRFCDSFFSREELPKHLRTHDGPEEKFVCQICHEHMISAVKFHYHECPVTKKAALFYHCKICSAQLPSKDILTIHLRNHDPDDFPADWEQNTCQLCGFIFLGRPNLVRHMASRECTHCSLKNVSSCQHQKHILKFHNSQAYHCRACDVQFLSQHSYVDHVSERECSGCNEKFEPSCEYLKHETLCKTGKERNSSHPEYLCLKCDCILNDTYVYDNHVRDHNKFPTKYKCKHCNRQFMQNHDYAKHMSKRSCPQCLGKFHPMCRWTDHVCFRTDAPSVSCSDCLLQFHKMSAYRKHCRTISCDVCCMFFQSVCTLNKHYETEHDGCQRVEIDDEASETATTTTPLSNSTLKNHWDIKIEVLSSEENEDNPHVLDSSPNNLKLARQGCSHCDEYAVPMNPSKLRRHLTGAPCSICKTLIAPSCLMTSHYVNCAFNLNPVEENKALLSSDGSEPVNCPLCQMQLKTMSGLKSHLKLTEHVCKECGEKFQALCVFRMHQAKTQHGRRENICPICSKGFQYSRDLKKHLLIHTGERPYDCLLCGNSYRNPGHLSYHLKVQHGGARPYKCKYCGRGFGALSGCNKHEKRHEKESEFKCDHCGMMFVASHSLTKHISTRVCLIAENDVPQKFPNMLDETPDLTMLKQQPMGKNHTWNDDEDDDIDNDDDDDSVIQSSDLSFTLASPSSGSDFTPEKKKRKRKAKPKLKDLLPHPTLSKSKKSKRTKNSMVVKTENEDASNEEMDNDISSENIESMGENNESLGENNVSMDENNESLGEINESKGEINESMGENNESLGENNESVSGTIELPSDFSKIIREMESSAVNHTENRIQNHLIETPNIKNEPVSE